MTEPDEILAEATSVLLVDWPHTEVPRALLRAGLNVFGYSPAGYSVAQLLPERPKDGDVRAIFPPETTGEDGFLVFLALAGTPSGVDIVNVYRPVEELAGIVETRVIPLGARTLWLQPPGSSTEARRLASDRGIRYVEGADIADVARRRGDRPPT